MELVPEFWDKIDSVYVAVCAGRVLTVSLQLFL